MNSDYSTSSRLARFLAALAASIVTGTLFGAVALGLTGIEGWSLLSHHDAPTAQAAVRPA